MTETHLLLPILLPLAGAVLVLLLPRAMKALRVPIALLATAGGLVASALLFQDAYQPLHSHSNLEFIKAWAGFGTTFALKLTRLNAFILVSAAAFGFLITLFSWRFMEGGSGAEARPHARQFFAYLQITLAMAAGAVLADDLVVLLFFWEGLLCTLFGLVIIGRADAWKTAIKALVIVGVSDLCLMAGIGLTYAVTGTLQISAIHVTNTTGLAALAMVLLLIGAMGKGGAMPFHSWIPDAAVDAPMPFMALIPAALEKLLGIYFMARITLDMFPLNEHSSISTLLMIVGAITILLAVAMALVQKDFKRLLSYHAISQVGYMILGIGTATVFGVVGGLFHMINNALYKSLLFCTGGAVEHRTGTTDLSKLGGLGVKMPITCACFVIAALSISGFPLTNGFFSKELIYEGALERNVIFYGAALLGSFLTAASFLKLGHAAFFGKRNPEHDTVREAPASMLLPMVLLAAGCLVFAYNPFSVGEVIGPTADATRWGLENGAGTKPLVASYHMTGLPTDMMLVLGTIVVLAAAVVNHMIGVKRTGKGLGAVDHIHYAPVLHTIYNQADRRAFDPYEWLLKLVAVVSGIGFALDRIIDWIQDGLASGLARAFSAMVRAANTGSYAAHILWAIFGAAAIVCYLAFNRG